jgi:selenocysteine lyase/cysteine desulfurase
MYGEGANAGLQGGNPYPGDDFKGSSQVNCERNHPKFYMYLDNAATSWPKPPEVARAMSRFLA